MGFKRVVDKFDRIPYAIELVEDKSVAVFSRKEWEELIPESGEITKLTRIPSPISGLTRQASEVVVVASGMSNIDPGIDVIRKDPKDDPFVYNVDHYTIIQNICLHPAYGEILLKAGVKESPELNEYLKENVFIVGPEKRSNHWIEEIPDHLKSASIKVKWFNKT
jgi:hypothetical protein